MKPTIKILIGLLLFTFSLSYGQMAQYHYKRELKGISGPWHKITLSDEVFGKVSKDLADIRIFGITADNDTLEAPYLLRLQTEKISDKQVAFKTLNATYNEKGYYVTFEVPEAEAVNQIGLDFRQQNFDWRVKLEGSQDQEEWFTIVEDYRILSIRNEFTDFQFTRLSFPDSKYRFFRLYTDSGEKPELIAAGIAKQEITAGAFRNYPVQSSIKENKQARQTQIDVTLALAVPVSRIKIGVKDSFDYYRPLTIKYLADSIKTEQGWKYNYSILTSGTLNSLEENEFRSGSTIARKLRIVIDNQDNQPLAISSIEVKGYIHELLSRFTTPATYFLTYGNKGANNPRYDIGRFTDKIPETLTPLELKAEQAIVQKETPVTAPLFKNKLWLWGIIVVIIVLLGWFSLKMIRKN